MSRKSARDRRHSRPAGPRPPIEPPEFPGKGPIPPRPAPAGYGLAIVWEIPDLAPQVIKEALSRRRIVAIGGRCPCGAGLSRAQRRARGSIVTTNIVHADGCPVLSPEVEPYIRSHALREVSIIVPLRNGRTGL